MSDTRLETALDGVLTLPDGDVEVYRPPADYELPLPPERARIVHGFKPDVDAWRARGYEVVQRPRGAAAALVVVPRAKALARDLVARAAAHAALVLVDGQRHDGIDSLYKACRKALGDLPVVTRAHGRLFWFDADAGDLTGWAAPGPVRSEAGYWTAAGVFSDGAVDRGSRLLAEALPPKLGARVCDLGAGWGYLSAQALTRDGVTAIDLVEAEALSLECARRNVDDERASFLWEDATRWSPSESYDTVLCNPPFHTSRAADPGIGRAFIAAAARILRPRGALWMVANRHLPYEATLREHFGDVAEIGGDGGFKLFHATRPVR
ncbi:methyltransferase, putative [Oceanicola granulosus HTCC2516]|uniref:Methyltransferase, putative n=1 Tax=Oceanicola granulosus (strain ATCC BAA-861 / DSM 15982 / KCTC 12143 / HTCC2516) TaxID=314256 RepID=Q2CDM7_OCEGH|nr:methyltransferase [Oceanicola granulosus]EAR50823.1 methyltransferase, putative [Oceanicola granulosus HTCC2516]